MNLILVIDTTQTDATRVCLESDKGNFEKVSNSRILKSQTVLPLIEELLTAHDFHMSDISEIRVHTGPGSFTGIRVGISIANALGSLLHVPVNGKRALALPTY